MGEEEGKTKQKHFVLSVGLFQGLDDSKASWGCLLCEVVGFFLLLFNEDYRKYG